MYFLPECCRTIHFGTVNVQLLHQTSFEANGIPLEAEKTTDWYT